MSLKADSGIPSAPRYMRGYRSALIPALHGETVGHKGETLKTAGAVSMAAATPPLVLVAAMGRAMLCVAGEMADGAFVTWVTPRALVTRVPES